MPYNCCKLRVFLKPDVSLFLSAFEISVKFLSTNLWWAVFYHSVPTNGHAFRNNTSNSEVQGNSIQPVQLNNLQIWPWSSPFHRRKSSLIWNNPNWPDQAFILERNIGSHFQISRPFLMLLLRALNYIRFYFLTWAEGYGNGNMAFYKLKQLNSNLISQPLCCNVKTRTAAKNNSSIFSVFK